MAATAPIACSEVWGGNRTVDAALVLPGITGHVTSRPYKQAESGGDVHYVSSCGSGRITRVLLADVAGHGTEVAHLAVRLRDAMRRYLNHIEPAKLAQRINEDLSTAATDTEGRFATALAMTYFGPSGRFTLCNAGHPLPLLRRAGSAAWMAIDQPDSQQQVSNLPLGVLEESGYTCRELRLDPGDTLLAYTDCFIEARGGGGGGGQLGMTGLIETLNTIPNDAAMAPSQLAEEIIRAVERRGYAFDDDLTLVVLRCTERTGGAPFFGRLAGSIRTIVNGVRWRNMPWPEMSWTNAMGLFRPKTGSEYRPKG